MLTKINIQIMDKFKNELEIMYINKNDVISSEEKGLLNTHVISGIRTFLQGTHDMCCIQIIVYR